MKADRQSGFTLIELLATVPIAAILLGVGVPSFVSAVKNSRIQSQVSDLRFALLTARSEAVKSTESVTVCARATDTTCGDDWTKGWLVFIDQTTPTNESIASIESTSDIIRLDGEISTDDTSLVAFGSNDRTASGASARNFITYDVRGQSDWDNGYFKLCDDRGAEYGKALNVALTGDIRTGRTSGTSNIPNDVFGREITCP